jgi:hypothetical protein
VRDEKRERTEAWSSDWDEDDEMGLQPSGFQFPDEDTDGDDSGTTELDDDLDDIDDFDDLDDLDGFDDRDEPAQVATPSHSGGVEAAVAADRLPNWSLTWEAVPSMEQYYGVHVIRATCRVRGTGGRYDVEAIAELVPTNASDSSARFGLVQLTLVAEGAGGNLIGKATALLPFSKGFPPLCVAQLSLEALWELPVRLRIFPEGCY